MKEKWSYAVVQSIFGSLWVGKSKNKPDEKHYFSKHEDAVAIAMQEYEENWGVFDIDDIEDYIEDTDEVMQATEEYEAINNTDNIEEIQKSMEKFVI